MLSRRRFLLTSSLLALTGCSQRGAQDPLWIGHVGPLSGPDRVYGERMKQGMEVALEEVNADAERKIAIVHADNRGKTERSESEAVRLVSLNRLLAMIGGRDSAEANKLAQALQP